MTSIHIVSNTISKSGKINLTNDFMVHLPYPIDALNKDAYLEVQNVCYPLSTKNVEEQKCSFNFKYKITKFMKKRNGDLTFNDRVDFNSKKYIIPSGIYDLQRLLDYMNGILDEYDIKFIYEKSGKVHFNVNLTLEYWLLEYSSSASGAPSQAHDGGVHDKFRVSSKDGEIQFEFNMSETLAFMLGFNNSSIVITKDKTKINNNNELIADHLPDVSDGLNKMFIYCEELEATLVGDSYSELLTTVPIQWSGQGKANGELVCYEPKKTLKKFKKSIITNLHIKIKDTTDKLIPFDSGTVSLDCLIQYA